MLLGVRTPCGVLMPSALGGARMKILTCSVLALGGLLLVTSAQAHIQLMAPAPRHTSQKAGPCGKGPVDPRGATATTFKPGETITVTWKETVPHPGHFRIAFDENGQRFTDPTGPNDVAPRPFVLKDNIADKTGTQTYSETVTLPNVQCTNCTLQLVQVMTDKQGNGWGNDDLYYQCADLILAGGDGGAPVVDAGTSSSSSSSSGGSSSSSGSSSGGGSSSSSGNASGSSGTTSSGEPTSTSSSGGGDDDGCNVHGERANPTGLVGLGLAAMALVMGRLVRRKR